MSTVPPDLAEARSLLVRYLDMHPGIPVPDDLDPGEVGIVGDASHTSGYHLGSDRVRRNSAGVITDYSVVESPVDRAGLTVEASGLDVGQFKVTSRGRSWTLLDFNAWLVGECERLAPDTLWIREVIYSPDGKVVVRWDRLGRRITGDDSHLTHTHLSGFRQRDRRLPPVLMSRWLEHIGVKTMTVTDDDVRRIAQGVWELFRAPTGPDGTGYNMQDHVVKTEFGVDGIRTAVVALGVEVKRLADLVEAGGGNADVAAILAGIDTRLAVLRTHVDIDTRDTVVDFGEGGVEQVRQGAPEPPPTG